MYRVIYRNMQFSSCLRVALEIYVDCLPMPALRQFSSRNVEQCWLDAIRHKTCILKLRHDLVLSLVRKTNRQTTVKLLWPSRGSDYPRNRWKHRLGDTRPSPWLRHRPWNKCVDFSLRAPEGVSVNGSRHSDTHSCYQVWEVSQSLENFTGSTAGCSF